MADLAVLVNRLTGVLKAVDDVRRETVDEEVAAELHVAMAHVNAARSILAGVSVDELDQLPGEPSRHSDTFEYRLSWECPSLACVIAHRDVAWESLTPDEWAALSWESSYRIADGGDIHTQRHTLEGWAEYHYQPVRNVRFERRVPPNPDDGWNEAAVRGATGVTRWVGELGRSGYIDGEGV